MSSSRSQAGWPGQDTPLPSSLAGVWDHFSGSLLCIQVDGLP